MSKSLEQLLGHVPLTETLRTVASGVPNPFPEELFTVPAKNKVLGDRVTYIEITGERRTSTRVKYGSPAIRRNLRDVGDNDVRCLHNFESFPIDMLMLQKLRSFEKYVQDEGQDWVRYQLEEAAMRQQNTRVITTASMLRSGAIYWDSAGNLLPTSSGADTNLTIDAAIPATHLNQINGILDASWALPNTDIPTHINNLQQFALQETGMRLTACLYGINVSKYIRQNNFCQAFMSRSDKYRDKMLETNEIPNGLFGIDKWIPVWSSFYEKFDGTIVEVWDDDLAVFMPNVDQPNKMHWWGAYEGSFMVPKSIDVQKDPMAAVKNAEIVHGMGGYTTVSVNPVGMEVHHFDTYASVIRNKKATYHADTAF